MKAIASESYVTNLNPAEIKDAKEWLYMIGFIDMLGVSLVIPAMPIYARLIGMSHIQIGFLISIYGALQIFASPLVGSWSDKQGTKHVLMISLCLTAVSYCILGMSGISGNLYLFIFGRIIAGMFKHTQTLVEIYLSVLLPTKEGLIAVGEFNAISNLGLIIGPLIGGLVADRKNGFAFVCSAAACIFLINSVIVFYAIPSTLKSEKFNEKKSEKWNLFTSLAYIDFSIIWSALLFRFLVAFAAMLFRDTFGLILREKYDLSIKTSGYIISYQAAIGAIAGFAVAPLIRYTVLNDLIFFTTICLCISLVFLVGSFNIWLLLGTLIPFNFTNSVLRVATLEYLMRTSYPDQMGAVLGVAQSCLSLARMLSPLCSGILLDSSPDGPALGGAVVAAIASLLHFSVAHQEPFTIITTRKKKHEEECETCRRMKEYFKAYLD